MKVVQMTLLVNSMERAEFSSCSQCSHLTPLQGVLQHLFRNAYSVGTYHHLQWDLCPTSDQLYVSITRFQSCPVRLSNPENFCYH
jgi:hypothetical protein